MRVPLPLIVAVGLGCAAQGGTSQEAMAGGSPDYGVGVVSFAFAPAPGVDLPESDTLVVRRAASAGSRVVARFLFYGAEPFRWSYNLVIGEEGVEGSALEFGYEVLGLPFDSMAPGSEWARVIYGRSSQGDVRRGWVRLEDGRTSYRLWADELPRHPLFFLGQEESIAWYDEPGGARVAFELAPAGTGGEPAFDYRLEPLEVEGRWMKVRVVTPNAPCTVHDVEPRDTIVWIEYLNDDGRPRVWYPTRGC